MCISLVVRKGGNQNTGIYWLLYVWDLGLNDQLFDDLNRRLKSTGASEYILSLKELYVDFMGMVMRDQLIQAMP